MKLRNIVAALLGCPNRESLSAEAPTVAQARPATQTR